MRTSWFSHVLLPVAVALLFYGISLTSGGAAVGWLAILAGLAGIVVSFFLLRGPPIDDASTSRVTNRATAERPTRR